MISISCESLKKSQRGVCSTSEDWMPQAPVLRPCATPSDDFSLDNDDFQLPESIADTFSLDSADSSSFCAEQADNRFESSIFETLNKRVEKKARRSSEGAMNGSSIENSEKQESFYKALERGFLKFSSENVFIRHALRKRSEQFSFKML